MASPTTRAKPPTATAAAAITSHGHHHAPATAAGIPSTEARTVSTAEANAPMP